MRLVVGFIAERIMSFLFQFELTAVYYVYTLVLSAQEIQMNLLILPLVGISFYLFC